MVYSAQLAFNYMDYYDFFFLVPSFCDLKKQYYQFFMRNVLFWAEDTGR